MIDARVISSSCAPTSDAITSSLLRGSLFPRRRNSDRLQREHAQSRYSTCRSWCGAELRPVSFGGRGPIDADKALYCGISEGEPPIKLICWRAKDGYTVSMTRLSRPTGRLYRPNRGNRDPVVGRKLQFGQPWSIAKSWTCISYRDGMTCVNRAGHGWSLGSRAGAKLF